MAEVTFSPSANIDVVVALKTIQNYFSHKESPELAQAHMDLFTAEIIMP